MERVQFQTDPSPWFWFPSVDDQYYVSAFVRCGVPFVCDAAANGIHIFTRGHFYFGAYVSSSHSTHRACVAISVWPDFNKYLSVINLSCKTWTMAERYISGEENSALILTAAGSCACAHRKVLSDPLTPSTWTRPSERSQGCGQLITVNVFQREQTLLKDKMAETKCGCAAKFFKFWEFGVRSPNRNNAHNFHTLPIRRICPLSDFIHRSSPAEAWKFSSSKVYHLVIVYVLRDRFM